jgi:hypothetical protein
VVIDFPSKVDAAWLDAAIARSLGGQDEMTILRLRGWRDMQIFAEGRLLQWMRLFKENGKGVVVDLGAQLPSVEDNPRHHLWELFREGLGAVILVDAAEEIRDVAGADRRDEIKAVQEGVLRSNGGEVGYGRERTLLRWDDLSALPSFRAFVEEEEAFGHIDGRIDQVVRAIGFEPLGALRQELTTFAYELVANTRMHACDTLDEVPIEGMRFAQIRRLRINRQRGIEQLPTEEGAAQAYLQRLASNAVVKEGAETQFIELTVADSGVGIPARLRRSMDVYRGPLSEEKDASLEAILTEASSRPRSAMGRGQGLDNALQMAHFLQGFVAIRTGRLELVRDTTRPGGAGKEWQVSELPYLPGTTVSLLLPWWPGAQGKIGAEAR